jgi:hypothetical protein
VIRRVHFSGVLNGDNGPAIVNRAYAERGTEWLDARSGPGLKNVMSFVRNPNSYVAVLASSTSAHHVILLLLARLWGRKAWYLAHAVARTEMRINKTWSLKHYVTEQLTLRFATGVICVSDQLRAQFVEEFPGMSKRVHVVLNGAPADVSSSVEVSPPAPGSVRIMTVGARPVKNLATLIQGIQWAELVDVELVVVGDLGATSPDLIDLPFVRHLPHLSHEQTLAWMASSHLYAQTSVFESFGLAVCESVLQGCDLLLSTSVGCLPVIPTLRDQNLVTDPFDVGLVARRLTKLVELARTGNSQRHECSRSWDDAARDLESLVWR